MKPISKQEAGWKYFREENRGSKSSKNGLSRYGKKMMNRAVRRFGKKEIINQGR
jgi:hypothetical protein